MARQNAAPEGIKDIGLLYLQWHQLQCSRLLYQAIGCIRLCPICLKFYAPWVMCLIKLHSVVNYQPSARNHLIFLPEVDMSVGAIYPEPAKEPVCLHNADHQSFTQPIEGVQAVTRVYPLASNTRLPHRAQTEATKSTIAQRPRKRSRVLNDRELLVALHQK